MDVRMSINIVTIFAMLLISCAKPVITNLQKGTYDNGTAPKDILNVSVSLLPLIKSSTEPDKAKTFFDLRDSLPHLFLKLMASKTKDADTLISLLGKPLSIVEKPKTEKKQTDFTEYKVRFAFSNLKKYYTDIKFMHPNTRLEFLTTTLTIPDNSGISIYNIDKLENEFDEIDLGTLSRDQTVSLNAKLSVEGALGTSYANNNSSKNSNSSGGQKGRTITAYDSDGNEIGTINKSGTFTSGQENTKGSSTSADAKVSASAEGSYANTTALKEAVAVKLKRLRTGFNFSANTLMVAQRGRPLGDISDNIYITATLKTSNSATVQSLNVFSFDKLYDENNKANKASNVLFSIRNIQFSPCDKVTDVVLTTSFEGSIRAVQNNSADPGVNALEFDDKVTYYQINTTKGNSLTINKNLFCKNAYKYTVKISGKDYVLKIAAPSPQEVDVFVDDAPELMLQWLLDNISAPNATQLTSNKFRMYFEDISDFSNKIYVVNDQITANDIIRLKTITGVISEKRTF